MGRFGRRTSRSEFEIRARGLDQLPYRRGAAAEGGRGQGAAHPLGAERGWLTMGSIPTPRSRSASCARSAATSSRTTALASTARRKRSLTYSASLALWSLPSTSACRSVVPSVTACAWSPAPSWSAAAASAVITRNRRIELRPERNGSTTVVKVTPVKHPVGTRIEISFGPALPCDENTLYWAPIACSLFGWGKSYSGKSSPWWYDLPNFRELLSPLAISRCAICSPSSKR